MGTSSLPAKSKTTGGTKCGKIRSPRTGSVTRQREDREAKNKSRPSNAEAAVPGAHHSFTSAHRSSHKTRSYRSSGELKDRSDRSRKSDEKSSYHSNRSPVATVPGAQAVQSSSRLSKRDQKAHLEKSSLRSAKGDEKGKEHRGNRAMKPGAERAISSPRDRTRNKISSTNVNGGGKPMIAAMPVEEEEQKVDAEEQDRINEMVENQQEQQRLQEDHQNDHDRHEAEVQEKARKSRRRNIIIACIVLGLLVGGSVAAFFALQGDNSSETVTESTGKEEEPPRDIDVEDSTVPTLSPIDEPSSSPTEVPLKYNPPSDQECERIAAGLSLEGEEEMIDRSFQFPIEVQLVAGNSIDPLVPDFETKIEKLLIPDLIGCSRDWFNKRRLRSREKEGSSANNTSMFDSSVRRLQNVNIRYAIAKASGTVAVTDDTCEKSSSSCSVVDVKLDLKVRGDEKIFEVAGIILEVFPNGKDIRPDLELVAPFDTLIIGTMRLLDSTRAPTFGPTANEDPSTAPSNVGVATPAPIVDTAAPVVFPTPPPTKSPPPTMAPTPTPPPTARPTIAPSTSPSTIPSSKPSIAPSAFPSSKPSIATSATPSVKPSSVPSASPSGVPSKAPSKAPVPPPTTRPASAPRLGYVPLLRPEMFHDQSSTFNDTSASFVASWAVDGLYGSESITNNGYNQWWRMLVDEYYGQLLTVNKVTVWNRANCCQERMIGVVVKLWTTDNIMVAQSPPLTDALVQTIDFGEVNNVEWITFHQDTRSDYLSFSEIEAWGSIPNDSRNQGYNGLIQPGMFMEQSSDYPLANHIATNAVDGTIENFIATDSGVNQWWRVRLDEYYGQLVTVNKITVWNRANCCPERLEGAVISMYGESDDLIATSWSLTSTLVQTVDFGEVTGVKWITVHQDSRNDIFTFAEIEAWGRVG